GLVGVERADVVLDQAAPFEDCDVRAPVGKYVDAHEIPARRTTLAGAPAATLEDVVVEVVEVDGEHVGAAHVGADDLGVRARPAAVAGTAAAPATAAPAATPSPRRALARD